MINLRIRATLGMLKVRRIIKLMFFSFPAMSHVLILMYQYSTLYTQHKYFKKHKCITEIQHGFIIF